MNTVKAGVGIRLNMRGFIPVIIGITSYISPAFRVRHLSVVGPGFDVVEQAVVEAVISQFGG